MGGLMHGDTPPVGILLGSPPKANPGAASAMVGNLSLSQDLSFFGSRR
jgi:hypothetical protein